jgi:hypothetical protein
MVGYSGTPLPKKLGIKPAHRIAFIGAPTNFGETLGVLPEGAKLVTRQQAPLDLIVLFVKRERDLLAQFEKLAAKLSPAGMLWIAWPKKASGVATDLTETVVRKTGLDAGLVDNKVCAIDEVWSGLRFVIRLKDRPRP